MNTPTMLYKSPGQHEIHGGKFDYTIVDSDDVEASQADGWYLTTSEALAALEAPAKVLVEAPAKVLVEAPAKVPGHVKHVPQGKKQ